MDGITITNQMTPVQRNRVEDAFKKDSGKLFNFIKKRGLVDEEAEDILQDVFYQFIQAYNSIQNIERSTSWLFTVARNKVTDYFRKKRPVKFSEIAFGENSDEEYLLADLMPDLSGLPDAIFARNLLWEAIMEALDELPEEQRSVFIQHEFENLSFKKIAQNSNTTVNTLISRKRYAILHLRDRLKKFYEELK